MKLSLKLALLNIRRYPLRTLGSAVCLLIFGFALFSAVTFKQTLNGAISNALNSRSSGNTVLVKNQTSVSHPDALETRTHYPPNYEYGKFDIEGVGELDEINLAYEQAPDVKTLIPNTYLEEFRAVSGSELLVAGRLPENPGEMMINEKWFKSRHFADYSAVLDKKTTIFTEYFDAEIMNTKAEIFLKNAEIVGVYSEEFLDITALNGYKFESENHGFAIAFLINPECKSDAAEVYCTIDKIDRVYADFCAEYGEENVIKSVLTVPAIERLSGFNTFIGNQMYLAAGACALIYALIRVISASNYIKEKSLFVTAADAFGCPKSRILGAFAAENIALMIPVCAVSALLGSVFVKSVFRLISAYIGISFDVAVNLGGVLAVLAVMLILELVVLSVSLIPTRKTVNN